MNARHTGSFLQRHIHMAWWLGCFAVIFLSWKFDFARSNGFEAYAPTIPAIHKNKTPGIFDQFSTTLVTDSVSLRVANQSPTAFMMSEGKPYYSQFCMGADILTGLVRLGFSERSVFAGSRLFLQITSALVLAAFAAWVATRLGYVAGIVITLFFSFADWLSFFSVHIYWTLVLELLPSVIPWLYFERFGWEKRTFSRYLFLHALLVFVRCLFGYEYVTCFILAPLPAVLFFSFNAGERISLTGRMRQVLLIGIVGCLGFGAAMAAHVTKGVVTENLTGVQVLQKIDGRAMARIKTEPDHGWGKSHEELKRDSAVYQKICAIGLGGPKAAALYLTAYGYIGYFVCNVVSLPGGLGVPMGLLYLGYSVALGGWFFARKKLPLADMRRLDSVAAASLGGFLVSFSWWFAARNHMIHHPHINPIILYFGFAQGAILLITQQLVMTIGKKTSA